MNFLHSLLMASFSLSVIVSASVPKLYFIESIKTTWSPMWAKFISVGFLPPMEMSLVLHEPALKPFKRKKKSKRKRLCVTTLIFFLVFSYLEVTIAVCIANNIPYNVGVMNVSFIV